MGPCEGEHPDEEVARPLGAAASARIERRVVTIAPGGAQPFVEAEWRDSLVSIESGEVDLECMRGGHRTFAAGDLLWLTGLRLRTIHNAGPHPLVIVAFSRRT